MIKYDVYVIAMQPDNLWIWHYVGLWLCGPEYVEIGWQRNPQVTNSWYPNKPAPMTWSTYAWDTNDPNTIRHRTTTITKEEVGELPPKVQQAIAEFLLKGEKR